MANKQIRDLPKKTTLTGEELIEIQDGAGPGSSKHAELSSLPVSEPTANAIAEAVDDHAQNSPHLSEQYVADAVANAVLQHEEGADPHPQYATKTDLTKVEWDNIKNKPPLGTASARNVGSGEGDVPSVTNLTQFGLGPIDVQIPSVAADGSQSLLLCEWANPDHMLFGDIIARRSKGVGTFQVADNADLENITPIESTQDADTALWFNNSLVWSLANTIVDTNGFLKQASPVLRLYRDRIEPNHEVPSTAEFFRFGPGHYVITGTLGLAQAGWCYEAPRDGHGSLLVFTNIEQSPDGTIVVNTYRPEYETGRLVPGEPMDIPAHRWVDIRLHAPEPAPED